MKFTAKLRARQLLLCSAATLIAGAAHAADATAPEAHAVDEVVVTGTSIKGVAPVGAATQTVSSEQLRATGLSNTTDILRTIPAVVNLGMAEGRGGGTQNAQANITDSSSVNLRGLGQESTLVLLDGRRILANGTMGAFYDVSIFPSNAISRVEVVADGASAIYGSDAVGGVVNFITKRHYNGEETGARYGYGDGYHEWRVTQDFGHTWSTGEAYVAYEHYERTGLLGFQVPGITQDLRALGGPDLRTNFGSPGTISANGTTYAIPTGQNGVGLTAAQLVAGTQNLLDINKSRSLLSDTTKDTVLFSVRQHWGDHVQLWASGYYAMKTALFQGTSLNAGAATATLAVPKSNPFFVSPVAGATSVNVNYSFINDFRALDTGTEEMKNIAGGFTWETPVAWIVDAYASYAESEAGRLSNGQLRTINLAAALADTNPQTAFNPFCDGFAFKCNNATTLASLNGFSIIHGSLRFTDAVAKASGPVFNIWGGPVHAAMGVEYTATSEVTQNGKNTLTVDPAIRVTSASREVKSVFGEILAPFVSSDNAMPGIQRLELSLAVRYENYSDFGSTSNPKIGLRWDPLPGLTFRGTYGTSFRAPTIVDIDFLAATTYSVTQIFDPVANKNVTGLTLLGARQGLQPETARTWTIGGEWRPPQFPGLAVTATYYNIDYKNRIGAQAVGTILANEALFPGQVIRNPSAAVVQPYLDAPYLNTAPVPAANVLLIVDGRTGNYGGLKQTGVDFTIDYGWRMADSSFDVGLQATFITSAEQSLFPGSPYTNILDTINNPISKRIRVHGGAGHGGWHADVFINYTGGYVNNLVAAPLLRDVNAWTTVDASVSYNTRENGPTWLHNLRLSASVVNLGGAAPPPVISNGAGVQGLYDSQNASPLGQFVAFEISKAF